MATIPVLRRHQSAPRVRDGLLDLAGGPEDVRPLVRSSWDRSQSASESRVMNKDPGLLDAASPQSALGAWLQQLRKLVDERVAAVNSCRERQATDRQTEAVAFQRAQRELTESFLAAGSQEAGRHHNAYSEAAEYWNVQLSELEYSTRRAMDEVEQRFQDERQAAQSSRDETTWLVGSLLDEQSSDSPRQQLQRLHAQIDGTESILQEAVRNVEQQRIDAVKYLERCRLSTEVGLYEPAPPPVTLSGLHERCLAEVQQVVEPFQRLKSMWLPRGFRGVMPVVLWLLGTAMLATPAWWFAAPRWMGIDAASNDPVWMSIVIGSAAALSLVQLLMLHLMASQWTFPLITEIFAHSRAANALFARWQRLAAEELAKAHQELDRRHGRQKQHRDEALSKAEKEFNERIAELTNWRRQELQRLQSYLASRSTELEQARDLQLSDLSRAALAHNSRFEQQQQDQFSFLEAHHAARLAEIDGEVSDAWQQVVERWQLGIETLTSQANFWSIEQEHQAPPWTDLPLVAQQQMPERIPLGQIPVSLADLPNGIPESEDLSTTCQSWQLPVALDLASRPALLLRYRDAAGRAAAVQLLQATMLRLLAMLPSGQVRFTILDPVSLGENFAAFMHLADFDELLISKRIWTEPGQIESQLAELTEHMETVLQMFLRNEFATLEDYNRVAGEVAEPYRILVVSGLPASFSDLALRRLWSILQSGARCGMIPLIAVDEQAPLPRGFDLADIAALVQEWRWQNGGWSCLYPEVRGWRIQPEEPPAPDVMGTLIKQFGQLAGDVRRVEVPFQRVAPAEDRYWTFSAAQRLEIPIGRSGATRTQALLLGTGTSQHVLIAGKTGSGKSTLLHAIITNAALHYRPSELQLYLIDFKKGVEFKVYARQQLPHARVVGIESDREFGVSVLERLDRELQERSAAFRDAGVADLAGFRRAQPQIPMPRLLLIIDEFQEFFVDDDPLAQQATLLLDRLIRQGRAFGVHAILGSQTLAGAYSLARSTLGQVAVRIALQCSEADAHLILSEENTAARLLTRPGEAIYNDANGLSSGNHLFQVVWLEDADRDFYLERLRNLQAESEHKTFPAIVFEGNVPADLRTLPLAKSGGTRGENLVWLGEAVSLRGAIGIEFAPAAGANLLIVGQDESAATGMLLAAAISIAENPTNQGASIRIFNGSPQPESEKLWHELNGVFSTIQLQPLAELESTLQELVEEVRRRDGIPGPPIFLALSDLVRFRKLRKKDDDFSFGGFEKKAASPADSLSEILKDGPSVGIHAWIWCDSMNTAGRWLSRDMLQQLEFRVALAMNANDSSQLIDSPVAGRLGANRAWLYRGDRGTLDKFRPYSVPVAGELSCWPRERLTVRG